MKTGKIAAPIAIATLICALLVLAAGPLVKYGALPWKAGLGLFALGSLVAGIGGIVCAVLLIWQRSPLRIAGAVTGLIAAAIFVKIVVGAGAVPPIHDITTDTANPPQFVAITPAVRGEGSNTLVYDPAIARQQNVAYPHIKSRIVDSTPAATFDKALKAVTAKGWAVAVADAASGRIEATATAAWWGFKDDVVIRLTPNGPGTRIDVRSVSRVGQSDLGANAARIEALLDAIGR
ncbi:MAG: DUF1499 domain-containing protein [Sphingomonas sp.]|nr:DUF1499 domain-containing protein [Sphingomonas sp.]